ncbi:MAG TPA: response regulator [Clostridiales bacterium]|nr:response regulator [Clostridiales bacterium]
MFRVLLVDDEPWDLLGMEKGFQWKDAGFSIIGQTTNPVDALKIILEEVPDVVFTDIRMPEISGIELIKRARENDIHSEFVIVSGYSEFQYAQEVIKYNGYYYLLKPIDLDEAQELLKRLSAHLIQKQNLKGEIHVEDDKKTQKDIYTYIPNESFKELLDYVNTNYCNEVSLNELSEVFHLNTTYICDLFKAVTGMTLIEYVTDIRMKKACELLKTTRLSLAEVAEETGYSDYYYFNKLFKRKMGMPPGKYRRGE